VTQAAAGNHRHGRAARGQQRRQNQADLVADPAGAVLVQHRPMLAQRAPVEHPAGIAHRQGQRHRLVFRHAAKKHRHGKGRRLRIHHASVGQAGHERADVAAGQHPAIALRAQQFLRQHHAR